MDIEQEIRQLKSRNAEVETNKAWETSATRRIFVILITFLAALLFLKITQGTLNTNTLLVSAAVPAGAFLISTLTLPPIKKLWNKWHS